MLPPGSRCITIYGLGYVVGVRLDAETGQPTAYAVALDSHKTRQAATIVPAVHVNAWTEEEIPS